MGLEHCIFYQWLLTNLQNPVSVYFSNGQPSIPSLVYKYLHGGDMASVLSCILHLLVRKLMPFYDQLLMQGSGISKANSEGEGEGEGGAGGIFLHETCGFYG